jgi:predicted phage terminase large subunit-like protein
VRALVSVPPRHAKTETFLHGIAWGLAQNPRLQFGYVSYAADFARSKSRRARDLARASHVVIRPDADALNEWRTLDGGGVLATGIGGPLTGHGVDILLVDDPHKNREEAESALLRQGVYEWFTSTGVTRVEPHGSIIAVHCIAESEPVLMADGGWLPVESVKPGDQVVAYERGQFVPRRVLAQRQTGTDEILRVKSARKSLRVNARHPFLLESGEWCPAGCLLPGDRVVVCDAPVGGEEPFDDEFVWLFGFLIGDGWVTSWKRHNHCKRRNKVYTSRSWCLCVAQSVYPELNARVHSAITRYFGRAPKTQNGYYRLDSNAAGRKLVALGLHGGAHGKRIPPWVYRLTPALKRAFLRGHADADRHEVARCLDSTRISSVSKALINDVRLLAISAGLRCGRISSFRERVRAPHSREAKDYECFSVGINFATSPEKAERIVAIEADGHAPVYDLTVEGAENFVAQGFVVHNTRWHPDDLIGRLQRESEKFEETGGAEGEHWDSINLQALDETTGEALWPERWPAEVLERRRRTIGEYEWAALFQGRPRPRGAKLFRDPVRYDEPSVAERRLVIGVDVAATKGSRADWTVAVVLAFTGEADELAADVLDVLRLQEEIPQVCRELEALQKKWNAPLVIEGSGVGKAVPQTLLDVNPRLLLDEVHPTEDKFTRAQAYAAGWNQGRVRLPCAAPWLPDFLRVHTDFTGVNDRHDDDVDAAVHAWNYALAMPPLKIERQPEDARSRPRFAGMGRGYG